MTNGPAKPNEQMRLIRRTNELRVRGCIATTMASFRHYRSGALSTSARQSRDSSLSLLDVLQRPAVQRIFVHDYGAPNVPSLRRTNALVSVYAERALLMAQRNDFVVVADPVDPAYVEYLGELEVGPGGDGILTASDGRLSPSTDVAPDLLALLAGNATVLDRLADRIDAARETRLNPYFASFAVKAVQRQLETRLGRPLTIEAGPPEAADLANRKDIVRGAAIELGVPTAPGEIVSWTEKHCAAPLAAIADAVTRHQIHTGKVIIRGAWAMRGSDNLTLTDGPDKSRLQRWLAQREHLRSYLVESFVPTSASPNLQIWIDDAGATGTRVDPLHTTNQRFNDEARHIGNAYPHESALSPALRASAVVLGRWLAGNGYRGPAGVDFIETVDRASGNAAHLLAEINGRINGSTYVLALWSRINQVRRARHSAPIDAWISNTNLRVKHCGFAQLRDRLGERLYTHATTRGVVPYNTGMLRHGIMNALILAGSVEEAEDIERELTRALIR